MVTGKWAGHLVKTNFENLDKENVAQVKNRIIDILGCIAGGANASGNSILLELIKRWGGNKEATILVHGLKVPAHNAAWLNSIMARSFDFGVVTPFIGDVPAPGHISESTIPTALTVAEWQHASGKELITALILGEDLVIRLIAAGKYIPGTGWDSPGIVNKFGTVAIAAKLMALNERQIVNGFGIVLDQLAGSFQSIAEGAHNFKLGQGLASRDGIISAEMAQEGWVGPKDPLSGKYAYFKLYCQGSNSEILTSKLGQEFYGGRCTFKPYPGCGWTDSVIDCALDLANRQNVDSNKIGEIIINVAPMHVGSSLDQPFVIGDFPQGNALFSFRYAVANALIRKNAKPLHYTEEYICDPAVGALANRCRVITDMQPDDRMETGEVKVKLFDGQEFSSRVKAPKGNPLFRPLTTDEIIEKFRENISFSNTISKENSEKILELIYNLEDVDDISQVVKLFTF